VSDQIGSPTYTGDLARVLVDFAEKSALGGLYHAAGPEPMTWHELATKAITIYRDEILASNRPVEIAPIKTEDWPTPARRPSYSVLSFQKMAAQGITPMRPVQDSLREFVKRLPEAV